MEKSYESIPLSLGIFFAAKGDIQSGLYPQLILVMMQIPMEPSLAPYVGVFVDRRKYTFCGLKNFTRPIQLIFLRLPKS